MEIIFINVDIYKVISRESYIMSYFALEIPELSLKVKSRSLSFQLVVFHEQSMLWLKLIITYWKEYDLSIYLKALELLWQLKVKSRSFILNNFSKSNCLISLKVYMEVQSQYLCRVRLKLSNPNWTFIGKVKSRSLSFQLVNCLMTR